MRSFSTTVKFTAKSVPVAKVAIAVLAMRSGEYGRMRNKIMPLRAGKPKRKANSPKSLSKVTQFFICTFYNFD